VRVGEFAWSTLEPHPGDYHFGWLERAIAEAARHHIRVVIGTPTDAPPVWLTSRYPQVLRIHADGRPAQHGNRRQFSYASPLYRRFCRDIVTRLAERFGHDPDVIGWQIDNEYTNESFGPRRAGSSISGSSGASDPWRRSIGIGPRRTGARRTPPGIRSRSMTGRATRA